MYGGRKGFDDRASLTAPISSVNYFQKVYDNKEVARLVSVLMSSINSVKKVCIRVNDLHVEYISVALKYH